MKILISALLFISLTGCVVYQDPNPNNYSRTEFYAPANSTLIYSEHYSYPQYNNINVYPEHYHNHRPHYSHQPKKHKYNNHDRRNKHYNKNRHEPDIIIKVK